MLAARFTEGRVTLEDVSPPEGDDVLVRVRSCGICGSDLTILDSRMPIAGTPGHEIAGELEDGTPVAIEPIAPCGSCTPCRDGDYQVCRDGVDMIYGIGRSGGMAEWIRVAPRCLVPLPRGLDPRQACQLQRVRVEHDVVYIQLRGAGGATRNNATRKEPWRPHWRS